MRAATTPAEKSQKNRLFPAPSEHPRLSIRQWFGAIGMLLGLPIAGVWAAGRPIHEYLHLPPLTRHVVHNSFSWPLFLFSAALDIFLVLFIVRLLISTRPRQPRAMPAAKVARFPLWGWIGGIVLILGWILAWTRFEWFAPLQGHTFVLPWIGYIVLVNAWSLKCAGRSLLTDTRWRFFALIGGSALFWWFFEYLNRFVENWYYTGLEDMGPLAYAFFASLAFATVLPAVLSTQYALLTLSCFGRGLQTNPLPVKWPHRPTGTLLLAASGGGLALIGVWPDALFSLVWFAPLLVITALQTIAGRTTIFTPVAAGDWRFVISAAVAALICGFFWELWNIGSLAQWRYCVPYVDRFHIFAMPVLGYGGYLSFGLECMLAGALISGPHSQVFSPSRPLMDPHKAQKSNKYGIDFLHRHQS